MDVTQDLARLGTGDLSGVAFEGQADSTQPGSLVLQGRQIKPVSGLFIEALTPRHKLCIEGVLVVCQQAEEVVGDACRTTNPSEPL